VRLSAVGVQSGPGCSPNQAARQAATASTRPERHRGHAVGRAWRRLRRPHGLRRTATMPAAIRRARQRRGTGRV